jgi:hypothetical protein
MQANLHKKMWSAVVVIGLLMPVSAGVAAHASTGDASLIEAAPSAPLPPRRITLPLDSTSVKFTTGLVQGVPQSYVLGILAQQQLLVATDNDVATLKVLSQSGNSLPPTYVQPGNWEFSAPETGDYTLVFAGQGPLTPTITVSLAPPLSRPGSRAVFHCQSPASASISPPGPSRPL